MGGEYLTSNTAIAYPFADDAQALAQELFPVDAFVDALVIAGYGVAAQLLYLRGYGKTPSGALYFMVGGPDDVFATVTAVINPALQWDVYTATDDGYGVTVSFVGNVPALAALADSMGVEEIDLGLTLPLAMGVTAPDTRTLLALELCNDGPDGESVVVTGDIEFMGGHNIDMTADGTDGIRIAAAAGAGIGRLPCDDTYDDNPAVPLGVVPVKGNIQIVGDDCYEIVPLPSAGMFMIQSRCQACCTCDDYTGMHGVLAELAHRLNDAKTTLDQGRSNYESGVAHYHNVIIPGIERVELRANAMRGPDWDDNRGAPNWIRIVLVFVNLRRTAVTLQSGWSVDFLVPSAAATVTDVTWEYDGSGGKFGIGQQFGPIASGKSLSVTVVANIPLEDWVAGQLWNVSVTAATKTGDITDNLSQDLTIE